MRFDLEALRELLSLKLSSSAALLSGLFKSGLLKSGVSAATAAGGAAIALLTVAYIAWPGAPEAPTDAVVVEGPVFTPVAMTPTAPAPVAPVRPTVPSEPALSESRFNDALNVTRAVQRQLKRAGCYDGPVNGVWNAPTRRGMAEFTDRVNAQLPVDRVDPVLLVLLETHNTTSCTGEAPAKARPAETASIAPRSDARDVTRVSVEPEEVVAAPPRAEDLGYSSAERRAPNPMTSMQTASTEPDSGSFGTGEAAALTAAGAAAMHRERAAPPERRRTARKYKKKPSLARSVSKGLKSLQRSLDKLF